MPDKKRTVFRTILLILALLSSPFACMGIGFVISALPGEIGFFQAEVQVENQTAETLYVTPITTTYGEPQVIMQFTSLRQRDFMLQPNGKLRLTFDSADTPLDGLVLCRDSDDCRILEYSWHETVTIIDVDSLPIAEADWLAVIQKTDLYSFAMLVDLFLALLPFIFFGTWLRLGKSTA